MLGVNSGDFTAMASNTIIYVEHTHARDSRAVNCPKCAVFIESYVLEYAREDFTSDFGPVAVFLKIKRPSV